MSLDRTHELVLASFEKQRGVELPQLQSEIAHLRAAGERRNADRIRELEKRVREIQRNDDENKYLLEFGSMMFREDVKPNIPTKEKRNAVSDPRSALCNLRLESGAFARVLVWSSGADLCRAVLSKVTGVDVEGAYASIEINGQRLDRGMVLWDIGGIRVASPSARSITKSSINELRFAMRETRDTWDVRVHDGRSEDAPEIAIRWARPWSACPSTPIARSCAWCVWIGSCRESANTATPMLHGVARSRDSSSASAANSAMAPSWSTSGCSIGSRSAVRRPQPPGDNNGNNNSNSNHSHNRTDDANASVDGPTMTSYPIS
jgi:hypothetical protein